jgi:hypothetical protein
MADFLGDRFYEAIRSLAFERRVVPSHSRKDTREPLASMSAET